MATQTLTITIDDSTGQVGINGPIDNKLLCYGLLELAKESILLFNIDRDPKSKEVGSKIIIPNFNHKRTL